MIADVTSEAMDVASEAAKLSLRIGTSVDEVVAFADDVGKDSPAFGQSFELLKAITGKVETVETNKAKLAKLQERCVDVTSFVVVRSRRGPSDVDAQSLAECLKEVSSFTEDWSSRNDNDIALLQRRLDSFEASLGLAGDLAVGAEVENVGDSKANGFNSSGTAVPFVTPARKDWHLERAGIVDSAYLGFKRAEQLRVVGLVGDSGSGKTTVASQIVRSKKVKNFFCDGIVWLSIDSSAKDGHIAALMQHLAKIVHQSVLAGVGPAPTASEDPAVYVKGVMDGKHGGKKRCLVVADNVCEGEVVVELKKTGMWVLMTTRCLDLVVDAQGEPVQVEKLSPHGAQTLLRKAAGVPPPLPAAAGELVELCGRSPMELEFVGRWDSLRGCGRESSWSEAAAEIRRELSKATKAKSRPNSRTTSEASKWRVAVFFAGLSLGQGNITQQDLYLAVAVMPDEHVFSMEDAYALLHDGAVENGDGDSAAENQEGVKVALSALEHWGILDAKGGETYCMHKVYAAGARECLMRRDDVRRVLVRRWTEHISSLDAVVSHDVFALVRLWKAVQRVGGDDWRQARPYDEALAKLDIGDAIYLPSVEAIALLYEVEGDHEGAAKVMQRVLDLHKANLGKVDLLHVASALRVCIDSVASRGKEREEKQLRKLLEAILDDPAMDHWRSDDDSDGKPSSIDFTSSLFILALCSSTTGRNKEAEALCRRALEYREKAKLSAEHPRVAFATHMLGCCMREAGKPADAEKHFRMALEIEEAKLGKDHVMVAVTLYELGRCVREDGRPGMTRRRADVTLFSENENRFTPRFCVG